MIKCIERDDELLTGLQCQICTCLLFNAKECQECDTAFCNLCIDEWLTKKDADGNSSCPNCKKENPDFKKLHRGVKALLDDTYVVCQCDVKVKYDFFLSKHVYECEKNKKVISCPFGCGM